MFLLRPTLSNLGWLWIAILLGGAGCRAPGRGRGDASGPAAEAAAERQVEAHAHYAAGISAELNRNFDQALEHFLLAAAADPSHPSLIIEVAGRLMRAGRTDDARALLETAVRENPDSAELSAWLGLVHVARGELGPAITAQRRAIRRDPILLLAYQSLFAIYLQQDRRPEALRLLDEAVAVPAADANFLVTIAGLYADYAQLPGVIPSTLNASITRALQRAVVLGTHDYALLQRIADGFRQVNAWTQAEAVYLDLLERAPHLPLLREGLAELYLRSGRNEKAAEQLEAITRENPHDERASYFLGALVLEERRYAEAEELFDRLRVLRPDFEPVYYDLAGVKLVLDKPDEALALMDEVRQRFRPGFLTELYTAMALAQSKRYAEAVARFTEAEVIAKADEPERLTVVFYFQFGAAAERSGDFALSETCFRRCLELTPDFTEALNYLGYMWADRNENLEEAHELIERAVQIEPDNAAYLDSMAWVLYRQNHLEDALEWIQKAVAHLEEPDAVVYDHLGDIQAALGNSNAAIEAWKKSLELEESDAVKAKLEGAAGAPERTP